MNPRIHERDELTVIGVRAVFELGTMVPGDLWKSHFLPRRNEVDAASPGLYGVFNFLPGNEEANRIEYVAGAAAASLDNIPVGMVGWTLPAGRYAEVEAEGGEVAEVCRALIADWLPDSGYRLLENPLFSFTDSPTPDARDARWLLNVPVGTPEELAEFKSWLGRSRTEVIYPS